MEEDVVFCLLMLSRDSWPGVKESPLANSRDEEDSRRRVARWRLPRTGLIKRQCARSRTRSGYDFKDDADGIAKIHECPFCSRVFASGQALGGHKRLHFKTSATTIIVTSCSQPTALTAAATCHGDFDMKRRARYEWDERRAHYERDELADERDEWRVGELAGSGRAGRARGERVSRTSSQKGRMVGEEAGGGERAGELTYSRRAGELMDERYKR